MHNMIDVFLEVPCLTEKTNALCGSILQKKWFKSADKRIIGQYLQKFIDYNLDLFKFIGVTPYLVGFDQNTSIRFRTSHYIGSIPLRSPDSGKQIGDFVVTPKFTGNNRYDDYIEILNLLGHEVSHEAMDSLPLVSGRNFRPPMYLEAVKFILVLEELAKKSWRKFDRLELKSIEPVGQINWTKYIRDEYKVENRLRYPSGRNVLSELHKEYSQIRYVFDICKSELLSSTTPFRIKLMIRPKIDFLEDRLYHHVPIQTSLIPVKNSDSPSIKNCKIQANKILNFNFADSTAWRIDFADVFEKYVQHIFKDVAKESGGRLLPNYKFRSHSLKYNVWELNYLEPDAILQKDNVLICIDAKYKSHMYNKYEDSEILKEDYRHDLHQILAYTSFSKAITKLGILCYPSQLVEIKETEYYNRLINANIKIKILGLPLKKDTIEEAKNLLIAEIARFERNMFQSN